MCFAYTPSDQLCVLCAKINDQHSAHFNHDE
jgi:hypothetical protein